MCSREQNLSSTVHACPGNRTHDLGTSKTSVQENKISAQQFMHSLGIEPMILELVRRVQENKISAQQFMHFLGIEPMILELVRQVFKRTKSQLNSSCIPWESNP